MPEYNISDHFYTENVEYFDEANNLLKNSNHFMRKLATPSVNETKNNIFFQNQKVVSENQTEFAGNLATLNDHRLKPLAGSSDENKKNITSLKGNLFSGSTPKPSSDDVQYCKYLSGTGPIISDDFLPSDLPQKARNPIIVHEEQLDVYGRTIRDEWEDLNDDDDDQNCFSIQNNPTGEWISPVMKEALCRQVSKEIQFKTLWMSVAWLVGAHFLFLVTEKGIQLHQINANGPNDNLRDYAMMQFLSPKFSRFLEAAFLNFHIYGRRSLWILVVIIIINAAKFAWPQDQCRDLPMTARQRELIGLKPFIGDTDDSIDVANLKRVFGNKSSQCLQVPQYPRVNKLSEFIRKKENDASDEDFAIALQNIKPCRRVPHS